jgi:hypothetical protein
MTEAPKVLASDNERQMARRIRDGQWDLMERTAKLGTLWFCWWDKARRHDPPADDVLVTGLISGMELLDWMKRHEDWWIIGEWDDARYAAPVQLTDAGRAALAERAKYDMEPVYGGMVEPGWVCTPAPIEAGATK